VTDHLDVTPRPGNDIPLDDSPATAPAGDSTPRSAVGPDRRTVLKAAGLLTLVGGGAAVLAGCVSTDTPAAPTSEAPSSPASSPGAEASSAEPSEAEPTDSESSQEEAPTGPSVEESSVPEGSGVILDDADFVVTQPSKGEFKAFSKICTHQSCVVAEVTQTIDCKCHGSRFSITDGSVVNGPASQALAEAQTTVTGGKVYVQA
jgi:Rieske Fe-S protein